VAAEEPVTSPDQHKPGNLRLARAGGVMSIVVLVLMAVCGNHKGNVENYFLYGTALFIVVLLVGDWVLRRNGLRP